MGFNNGYVSRSYPYSEANAQWHPLFPQTAVKAVVDAHDGRSGLCE